MTIRGDDLQPLCDAAHALLKAKDDLSVKQARKELQAALENVEKIQKLRQVVEKSNTR